MVCSPCVTADATSSSANPLSGPLIRRLLNRNYRRGAPFSVCGLHRLRAVPLRVSNVSQNHIHRKVDNDEQARSAVRVSIRPHRFRSMSGPAFEAVVPDAGFLPDHRIRAALEADYLLERGTWEVDQIRHASYTIRLGQRVEIERGEDAQQSTRQRVSLSLTRGGAPLELRPGDTALLFSLENLRLPPCVLGFTVARGLLFVESLVPENTYIDPGFRGQIYTTVTNLSGRILELSYGTPIARLFFYRLPTDVEREYTTGPAIGIDQHLPSRPSVKFATREAAQGATTLHLLADLESTERGGKRTAELLRRQSNLIRWAVAIGVIWPMLLQVAASWSWLHERVGTFAASVLASIVAVPIVYGCKWLLTRLMEK